MSAGGSSRLNKALVDEQEKAVAAFNFPFDSEDPGVSLAIAIANMGVDISELENAMNAEFKRVQEELISEREFQKLRNQMENNFVSQNSRVVGIAENLADYHTYLGDANLINNELERYMKVTREDIQRVAKQYFVAKNRVTLHYMPKVDEP